MHPKQVVTMFREAMRSNDFHQASLLLSDDFRGVWPQSSELVNWRKNFAAINTAYPANDQWRFQLNSIVAEGVQVVTDVSITDGVQKARAITFHTVEDSLINRQVEFWPDDYEAPEWRARWVEALTTN